MKDFRYIKGASSLSFNADTCTGCGMCAIVCPHGVVEMKGRKARIADADGCMECGACALNCPVQAIRVKPGVGCAAAIIKSWIKGSGMATCGDSGCC